MRKNHRRPGKESVRGCQAIDIQSHESFGGGRQLSGAFIPAQGGDHQGFSWGKIAAKPFPDPQRRIPGTEKKTAREGLKHLPQPVQLGKEIHRFLPAEGNTDKVEHPAPPLTENLGRIRNFCRRERRLFPQVLRLIPGPCWIFFGNFRFLCGIKAAGREKRRLFRRNQKENEHKSPPAICRRAYFEENPLFEESKLVFPGCRWWTPERNVPSAPPVRFRPRCG